MRFGFVLVLVHERLHVCKPVGAREVGIGVLNALVLAPSHVAGARVIDATINRNRSRCDRANIGQFAWLDVSTFEE